MGLSPTKEIVKSREAPKASGGPDYLGKVCARFSFDSTRTRTGSLITGNPAGETMRVRIGFVAIKQNTSQIIPNKKSAPKAMRLNPTMTTSDIALRIDNKRQYRALRAGRTKSRSCP